jgi:hypothetical protein
MTQTLNKSFDSVGFKYSFPGIESIKNNYAQANQDLFVLSMLGGRRNGTWLDVGCGWPLHISNTALLEFDFGWRGISIDSYQTVLNEWPSVRTNIPIHGCGYKVDFAQLIVEHGINETQIDYLSLDCDPASQTYDILLRIPFDQYQFAVITFEHDNDSRVRQQAQTYLAQRGYKLVVSNISDQGIANPYEDWYVHPDLVDPAKIAQHLADDNSPKDYIKYFYQNTP